MRNATEEGSPLDVLNGPLVKLTLCEFGFV